jgi:cytochrome c peroxidase
MARSLLGEQATPVVGSARDLRIWGQGRGRMWRTLILAASIAGCWTEDALVDGTFTREQWELMQGFVLGDPPPSNAEKALLGQLLFFDKRLSGPILIDDPAAPGRQLADNRVACASCHNSPYFIDTRSEPGNISIGTGYTRHNALSLVNVAYKRDAVEKRCPETPAEEDLYCARAFSWNGQYETAGAVLALASGKGAMNSTAKDMATVVRDMPEYRVAYPSAFDVDPATQTDEEVFANLAVAFDAYIARLASRNAPIDRYLQGEVAPDGTLSSRGELGDRARRGFAVFVGKGMCVDCHRGPLFSDLEFHNTGVPQRGPRVPTVDLGLAETATKEKRDEPENIGKFLTQPLRHIAETAPYMHAGQLATLGEVIQFYRNGGELTGFSGEKDPRMQPLEIDDDEALDLEEFLRSALTGEPVPFALRHDLRNHPEATP